MRDRIAEIKAKGFNVAEGVRQPDPQPNFNTPVLDFNRIKVGAKTLEDAVFSLSDLKKSNSRLADKQTILKAISDNDIDTMREASDFFFKISGIYSRILRYMAFMYRYDWILTPYVNDEKMKNEKLLENFHKGLTILDKFEAKKQFQDIALKVLRYGCYYAYKVPQGDRTVLQELPASYCRSRFFAGNKPAVEFHMKFFDDNFRDTEQRARILKLFPKEFEKGYRLYKQGMLPAQFQGDQAGWYLLDPTMTVKFNMNGEDYPLFISVIPLILDLDEAQALDRKKTLQKLLKIIIQKMPMDKNGDLIFDVEEAQQLHNNAVQMLSKAVGVDVLTTFADVEVADMTDRTTAQTDDLARVERQLFNEAGVSQMQFNTDGNIALEKSIGNDEATMYNLLLQFEDFLNELLDPINSNPKKVQFMVQMLPTTIYNYKELAKLYKEQVALGYSKMLPQIALGHSQSMILATAYFENDVLNLVEVFVPPMSSNTMSAKGGNNNNNDKSKTNSIPGEEKKAGRKELDDDKKSAKTIQNKESMS